MRVFVTGATGFVGHAIVRELVREGYEVRGLVRSVERARCLPPEVRPVVGDMREPGTFVHAVAHVDAVIHAAQQRPRGRWRAREIDAMHHSDWAATRALAAACQAQGKHLIYTSGALAHAPDPCGVIGPNSELRPCLLARGHAAMVAELSQPRWTGLRYNIVSPGFVYGSGGFVEETISLLRRGRYRVIGQGDNPWSLVHVDDLAQLYVQVIERGKPGENYFVADDVPLERREFVRRLAAHLGLSRVGHVPRWLASLALGRPMVEAICAALHIRDDRPRTTLGWRPRFASFDQALAAGAIEPIAGGECDWNGHQPWNLASLHEPA